MMNRKPFQSIPRHDGPRDVSRASGDKMRAELRNSGIEVDTAEPLLVLAKIKTWRFDDFAQPIKRGEMTNMLLVFKIHALCKPNDIRPTPNTLGEKATMRMVNDLQNFIELCADRHSWLGTTKSRAQIEGAQVWFQREHTRMIRLFEEFLRAQKISG